ncbi:MAG: hypothetical protein KAQ90_11235 [Melioribacteraceae bacterium]|nr:hypothetical protein [Melioribacteraceae bacterium]
MEESQDQELNNEHTPEEEEEYELSHTDKLVGIFTEPGTMFTKVAQFPAKALDWVIPVILFIIVVSLSTIIMQSNPQIKYSMMEKQITMIEEQFDEAVSSGQMTQEQADQQLEMIRERMEGGGAAMLIPQIIGIVIVTFLIFFVVSGVYLLFAKFVLKGDGSYSYAMIGYGLPFYIATLQVIIMVILAMILNKFLSDTSVGTFIDADKQEFVGFLLSKLDIFSIWFYAIVSIAYAKLFKSESTGKYFVMIFGLWIGFSIIFFFLAKAVPFLKWFGM